MFEGKEASHDAGAERSLTERIKAVAEEIDQFTTDTTGDALTGTEDAQARLMEQLDMIVAHLQAIERENAREEDDYEAAQDHTTIAAMVHTLRTLAAKGEWEKVCRGLGGYLDYVKENTAVAPEDSSVDTEEPYKQAA